jgi:hypothetical protein
VKSLQLLLQQSKGFYTTNSADMDEDDEEDDGDDFDQYEEDYEDNEEDDDDPYRYPPAPARQVVDGNSDNEFERESPG